MLNFALYGLDRLEALGHDECSIAEFCRNPLHPGPCKGWKHTLKAVAPGLHAQMERSRLERVDRRRAERTAAALARGESAPKFRKLAHERPGGGAPGPEGGTPTPDLPPVSEERRKRIAAADAKIRKTGPRDGDGDGKLNEGKYVKKGRKPGQGGDAVDSTPTKGEGGVEVKTGDEPIILKGDRQRANLRAVVSAGDAGYDNKRGFLNKKDRDEMINKGLVTMDSDGRLRATDKGRASHEASIPRRNGEEIGWDGKTDSERAAELEAAKGKEKARLEAEAAERFRSGIPDARPRSAGLGGPNSMRAHDAGRKIPAMLKKDLGEDVADYTEQVTPLARDWADKMRAVDEAKRYNLSALQRANWLLAARKADPANADVYTKLHEENKAELANARAEVDAARKAAEESRQALGAAVLARYQAKGKRKTLAGLKIPEAGNESIVNDMPPSEARIRSAADKGDAAIKGLDHNLEPWQIERAKQVRDEFGAAVVEQEKADAALEAARYAAGDARRARDEHFRKPALLRESPEGQADIARINDEMTRTGKAERMAEERQRSARDRVRTADATLVDTARNLRTEQERRGGPKPETTIERERRQRGEARARVETNRRVLDAGLRAGGRKTQLAEAKRLGIDVPRGQAEDDLVKKLTDANMDERLRADPPGAAGRKDLDPDVVAELYRQAKVNEKRYDAAHNEHAAQLAREDEARGMIPYARASAALTVLSHRGMSYRDKGWGNEAAKIIGLPALPKGTGPAGLRTEDDFRKAGWVKETLPIRELKAGDLVSGMAVTAVEEDDGGKVRVQGLGTVGMDVRRPEDGGRETTAWRPPGNARPAPAGGEQPTPDAGGGTPGGGEPATGRTARGKIGGGTDISAKLAAAFQQDLTGDPHGFRKGETPYDKLQAEYGDLDARDGVLTQLTRDQGWGLPARGSVDEALDNNHGGTELFRGVRPKHGVSADEQFRQMRDDPDFAYGSGIYGNGIYFSVDKRVADAFAVKDPDSTKATDEGKTIRVALHPDARIITMKKLEAERKKWVADHAQTLKDNPGMSDWLYDNGRFATMLGYDAMRIDGQDDGYRIHQPGSRRPKHSKATQYVVFNRGALTMEDS